MITPINGTVPLVYVNPTMPIPDHPPEDKIPILDNRVRRRTTWQNICYYGAHTFNWLQIFITYYITGHLYQQSISEYTYFRGGTTTCQLFYDYFRPSRWLYFAFAFNYFDLHYSFNIGQKFTGYITLPINIGGVVLNAVLLFLTMALYLPGANVDGNGDTGNIAQDWKFCGVQAYINNTANNCDAKNPTGLALTPTVTASDLRLNVDYQWFLALLILMLVFGLAKTALSSFLKETLGGVQDVVAIAKSGLESIQTGAMIQLPGQKPKQIVKERNLYDNLEFFDVYRTEQVVFFFPVELLDFIAGCCYIVWLGWFQQNTGTVKKLFVAVGSASEFREPYSFINYVFYASIAFSVLFWYLSARLGTMFDNIWAVASSMVGSFWYFGTFVFMGFAYWISCNGYGFGDNICNDPQRFCAAVGAQGAYYLNAANNCKNNYPCPTTYTPAQLGWADDYKIITIFVCYWFLVNMIELVYSTSIQLRIRKFAADKVKTMIAEDEAAKEVLKEYMGLAATEEQYRFTNQLQFNPYMGMGYGSMNPYQNMYPPQQYTQIPTYNPDTDKPKSE